MHTNDRVSVRKSNHQDAQGVFRPGIRISGENFQCYEEGEGPDLRNKDDKEPAIYLLRIPGPEEELEERKHGPWDNQ